MKTDPATVRFFPIFAAAKGLALGIFLFAASPATATQEYILPTLFDVTGVAANDVLNIRAAPDASAEVIGTLSPNARDIEVVGYDETGRWARINTGERSGWALFAILPTRSMSGPPEPCRQRCIALATSRSGHSGQRATT